MRFRVKLDDRNASHPLISITVSAENEEAAGKKALFEQGKRDCGPDHAKQIEDDGYGEDCCTICGCSVDHYDVESVTEVQRKKR